jgi:transcriptional regulator with XRE-family HTH domain
VDVSLVIRRRLKDLGLEQRDLAVAARVTDSYVSQLLASKKAPPAPNRTDLYPRIEALLRLPPGQLARLAEAQRREQLKRRVAEPPQPLFRKCRATILRKCAPQTLVKVREIFDKEPFGVLERLVTQTLLEVARNVAREESGNEKWLRLVARSARCGYEQIQTLIQAFLDTDVFSVSVENGVSVLAPLIECWDIDLATFAMEIVLSRDLAENPVKKFEYSERKPVSPATVEPGLEEFLRDRSLSGDATGEEIEFLKRLRFKDRLPAPIYYYRELQNLRDPLHFRS